MKWRRGWEEEGESANPGDESSHDCSVLICKIGQQHQNRSLISEWKIICRTSYYSLYVGSKKGIYTSMYYILLN